MSTGLIALLDDVASLARVAAASLDDVVGQAAKAGAKAAGVVIDDGAVTPQYVVGFTADRELPIVARIALGSLRNKLVVLLPAALLLHAFAPGAITPLLMFGGLFLCYEGAEKVYASLFPHAARAHESSVHGHADGEPVDARTLEDEKVRSAIKTDFILSAEIMAIALAEIPPGSLWLTGSVLAIVGVGITVGVYGAVAGIVKADDAGVVLARSTLPGAIGALWRGTGRGLVRGMPLLLRTLGVVGTAAMVWVGGGIFVHGLEHYGLGGIAHAIHAVAQAAGGTVPMAGGAVEWATGALGAGLVGLLAGAVLIPVVAHVVAPLWLHTRAAFTRGN
jgi:hypothetical protein